MLNTLPYFIIGDPTIKSPEGLREQNFASLHQRSMSFGRAIRSNHLAVWFWRSSPTASGKFGADNIHADRNAAFCQKFNLPPSRSPYAVVTTAYRISKRKGCGAIC